MTTIDSHDEPTACENCAAPLHGHYCHACGQSVINPVRNAAHALEEVFESFWHLDGRIFRTLRDLIVPARVACNYLAGQRVRYVAPLRLFVILSVVTFFVAQFTVDFGDQPLVQVDGNGSEAAFAREKTVADVDRARDQQVQELKRARDKIPAVVSGARTGLDTGIAAIEAAAAKRKAELKAVAPATPVTPTGPTASASARTAAPTSTDPTAISAGVDPNNPLSVGDKPWNEKTNPLLISWLPGFANRWLNHQIGRGEHNLPRMRQDPELFKHAMLSTVPTVLFMMVPVFALLLKLGYLGSGRLYLEHLVVALYSHAFLCLSLLALFLLVGLENALSPRAGWIIGLLYDALWIWMPLYLLLMQKRVYGDGWPLTLLRYCVIGTMYLVLVGFAAFGLVVTSMVRM